MATAPPGVGPTPAQRRQARVENARRKREELKRKRAEANALLAKQQAQRTRPKKRQKFQGTQAPAGVLNPSGTSLLQQQRSTRKAQGDYGRSVLATTLQMRPDMSVDEKWHLIWQTEGEEAANDFLRTQPGLSGYASFENFLNTTTGIPDFLKDPSIMGGLGVAASVVPVGRAGRAVGAAFRVPEKVATRAGWLADSVPQERTIATRGQSVTIPAAGSRTGRFLERGYDALSPDALTLRRIRQEQTRTAANRAKVKAGPTEAARRIGSKFKADKQVALRLVAEGLPLDEQVALWAGRAAKATNPENKRYLQIHAELVRNARKYLNDTPTGPDFKPGETELKRAWRLMGDSPREKIYLDLEKLTEETIRDRPNYPGRQARGEDVIEGTDYKLVESPTAAPGINAKHLAGVERETAKAEARLTDLKTNPTGQASKEARARFEEAVTASGEAYGSRRALRRQIDQQEKRVTRARTAMENAQTAPRGFTPATIASRIKTLNDAERRLTILKAQLRRAERQAGDYVATQEAEALRLQADSEDALRIATSEAEADVRTWREILEETRAAQPTVEPAFTGGKRYIPDVMGVPGTGSLFGRPMARQANAWARGGWRQAVSGVHRDASIRNAWEGTLRETGFLRTDVTNLTADSAAKAIKLDSIIYYRNTLLKGATDVPQRLDDVAIKLKPGSPTSPEMQRYWAKWDEIEAGGLSEKDIKRLWGDGSDIDGLLGEIFPKGIKTIPGQPIKGYKFVPKEMVDTAAMGNPMATKSGVGNVLDKTLGSAADLYNDLQRAAILYLNPAYVPIQLMQNTVLNIMQQGAFAPANWNRAVKVMGELDEAYPEAKATIDTALGTSMTRSLDLRSHGTRAITGTVGKWVNKVADQLPRWASIMHEGRRVGVNTAEEWNTLTKAAREGNESAMGKLDKIILRAKDAIGDFDRMGTFEKQTVSRYLFFYPWLKAGTRLTYRFPAEHPIQAAAFGVAGYKAHEYSGEQLGDRPWYAQFRVPIPGQTDEEGNPYTVDLSRIFAWSTPAQLVGSAYSTITGAGPDQAPQLLGQTTPAVQNIITALTGTDEFGRDVGKGVGTFARQSYESLPPYRFYEGLTTSDEEKQDRLFPRDRGDELVRIGASSFVAPYNPKVGQERMAAGKPKEPGATAADAWDKKLADLAKQLGARGIPDPVVRAAQNMKAVAVARDILKQRLKDAGWKPPKSDPERDEPELKLIEEVMVRMEVLSDIDPSLKARQREFYDRLKTAPDLALKEIISNLDDALGANTWSNFYGAMNKSKEVQTSALRQPFKELANAVAP